MDKKSLENNDLDLYLLKEVIKKVRPSYPKRVELPV